MEDECSICCEKYNKSTRKAITCQACDYSSCKSCIRKYLLEINNEPNCPSCHSIWTQEFIINNCNRSWFSKEHKEHRSKILIDYEMSQLPDTMVAADNYKFKEQLEKRNKDITKEIKELRALIWNLQEEKNDNNITIREIKETKYKRGETKKFILACPAEDCRGFLSENYKCDLCQQTTCPNCNEIMEEGHTCDEEAVQSAELIKKETKPCPKCGIRIFKIDGCDQMWCTECHVAFSWRTGRFETGIVHNPHFYQWQREMNGGEAPRVPDDNPCQHFPDWRFTNRFNKKTDKMGHLFENKGKFTSIFTINVIKNIYENFLMKDCSYNHRYTYNSNTITKTFAGKFMWYNHILIKNLLNNCLSFILANIRFINWDRNKLNTAVEKLEDNTELRIKYLLKRISKKELTKQIIKRNIDYKKKVSILNIYDLIRNVSIEIFNTIDKIHVNVENEESCKSFITDIMDKINNLTYLRNYCNEQFKIISVTHNMTVPYFDKMWHKYSRKYTFEEAKLAHQPVITPMIDPDDLHTFKIKHVFSEIDFPTTKTPTEIYSSYITIPKFFNTEDLHNYLTCKFMGVYGTDEVQIEDCNKIEKPKSAHSLVSNWPSLTPFTIVSKLETGLEYLYINHNKEYVGERDINDSAVNWMKYRNTVIIQWNGSRVKFDGLFKNLEYF